ncbi:hypothetical protein CDAR_26291 [Caerostris darwini]|uniref:Uncharacterized protein n=1 Tax=Caerostris darwini TaxID=1538125 RepID=A0AAV4NC46_9ARAC|nr:hypothetical protein CDAR_26291 [Caerostris darwini]
MYNPPLGDVGEGIDFISGPRIVPPHIKAMLPIVGGCGESVAYIGISIMYNPLLHGEGKTLLTSWASYSPHVLSIVGKDIGGETLRYQQHRSSNEQASTADQRSSFRGQESSKGMKGTLDSMTMSDMGDMFSDGMATQSEADTKEEEEGLEPKENSVFIVVNGLPEKEELEVGENNNEPTTPNQVSHEIVFE